jgi:putative transposase
LDRVPALAAGPRADQVQLLVDTADDLLAFTHFPVAHGKKIWSTNPLERLNGQIKRRTNVVGIFPNDASVLRLVTAVVVETHDEWAVAERRYLSEQSMAKLRPSGQTELTNLLEAPQPVTA